ncbi:MAG: FkbM family methyltransferase [Alphaproteobacteria bacterium]|nr:FkbM family methyltransferase [Alphaproteobacteria bacterium]
MWIERGYEKKQLSYMIEQAKKYSFNAFLDIGTNFGLYSCILGGSNLIPEVHSFECDPRNIYHLYAHLKMNALSEHVTVHDFAVGNTNNNVIFQMATDDNTGTSHVGKNSKKGSSITIKQKSLDSIFDFKNKTLLIKIDVEGYEESVLLGMQDILNNNKCFIQIEILDNNLERVGKLLSAEYKNLHQIGHDFYFTNL